MQKKFKDADVDILSAEFGNLSKRSQEMVTALAAAAAVLTNGGAPKGADALITVDNSEKMPPIADVIRKGFTDGAQPLDATAKKIGKPVSVTYGP